MTFKKGLDPTGLNGKEVDLASSKDLRCQYSKKSEKVFRREKKFNTQSKIRHFFSQPKYTSDRISYLALLRFHEISEECRLRHFELFPHRFDQSRKKFKLFVVAGNIS